MVFTSRPVVAAAASMRSITTWPSFGLAGRDFDINDDPAQIVDNRMLLVGRFEPAISAIGRH
jgi:hypothetical protein